jgi:hypothetical protein
MRTYRTFLILISLFHFVFAFSQKDDGLRIIKESGSTTELFEKTYYKNTKIPFREIIVFDKRFDTSKIGYCNINLKIQLGKSFSAILNNYFKNNLDPSSSRSLVIFIKSFWLQKGAIDNILNKKIIQKPLAGNSDYGGSCTTELEAYSESGSNLKALFKIDTFFINLYKNLRKNTLDEFFFLPFDSIVDKLETINIQQVLEKKTALSREQVNKYYNNRFNTAVLKDSIIKKGIFLTFEDFMRNKPVETDFKFSNGAKTDELYQINNGNETLVTKYWGFCDGKDLFIQAGFSAFKAMRQQNTFEIFGAKHISNYHNNPQQGDIKLLSTAIDRKILQVNMDTGKLY